MNYRHELKFLVSDRQLEVIRYRLKLLMKQDAHQKRGIYTVRSLYFDDLNDSYMQENEDGIDNRRKFRIRIYEGDTSLIHLEKKIKYRGMTRKVMKEISKEDCLIYMSGYAPGLKPESDELEKEIFVQIHAEDYILSVLWNMKEQPLWSLGETSGLLSTGISAAMRRQKLFWSGSFRRRRFCHRGSMCWK